MCDRIRIVAEEAETQFRSRSENPPKRYQRPRLIDLGTIVDLTKGGAGLATDFPQAGTKFV